MTHLYKLITLAVLALTASSAGASSWSYEWAVSSTSEKNDGYPSGFYNFGASYDAEATSQEKTFNEKTWTATFDKGTKLAYTATGQSIGSTGGYTRNFALSSDAFSGKVTSLTIRIRSKVTDATVSASVNGTSYYCDGAESPSIYESGTTFHDYTFTPTGDAQSGEIIFSVSLPTDALSYLKSITVEYEEDASTVAIPTFSPESGSFDQPFDVTISAAEGATILYTLDGSSPRGSEGDIKTYDGTPVTIDQSCTLKAVAKVGENYSAVSEAKYIIRTSPELTFYKDALTIELLEEGFADVINPHKVSPIKFSSSNSAIAWADQYGMIYTYGVGEATITASFAGDENYLPQSISLTVTVIAKEPLANLTVTPASGKFDDAVEVSIECSDPRAAAIWYHIGDEAMTLDDLGILDEFTIEPSTSMTLTIDHDCVLSVQAMGENVWSEPQFLTYEITLPLKADFSGPQSYAVTYRNGFDSTDEISDWNTSSGSSWQLTDKAGDLYGVPSFSSINPDSQFSLYHPYGKTGDTSVITSPVVTVPENGLVRFYSVFNPIWIYDGNLILYICEDTDDAQPVKIWDAFLTSQEAGTDDAKWTQYSADISKWSGKEVYFAFTYELNYGDDVLIDDFEVVAPENTDGKIIVAAGDAVAFTDLSTSAEKWSWEFPGAEPATSTEQNPVVTYSVPGTYDVTLTVHNGEESQSVTREGYVIVRAQAPTAIIGIPQGVYYSPEASIIVPVNKELTFTDASAGAPESWAWTLPGTDLGSSENKDVTVKYLEEGTYDIDLSVSNQAGESSTYIHGVKAGGESLAWNIAASENDKLEVIQLGWYGNYGGSNWLDMDAFAEYFEAPVTAATISGVNVYFGSTTYGTEDAVITVSVTKADESGMPGEVLVSTSLPAGQLVDASVTYNDPTIFTFDTPVKVDEPFFITISGFPNQDNNDNIAMYALRRGIGQKNTAYHLLKMVDEDYNYTGEVKWFAETDDPTSFAIAPKLKFDTEEDSAQAISLPEQDGPVTYWTLQGIQVKAENLTHGIYIRRQGSTATKIRL